MRASMTAELVFENCKVPIENLVSIFEMIVLFLCNLFLKCFLGWQRRWGCIVYDA